MTIDAFLFAAMMLNHIIFSSWVYRNTTQFIACFEVRFVNTVSDQKCDHIPYFIISKY